MYIMYKQKLYESKNKVQKLSEDCPENSTQVRNPGKALHN